MLHTAPAAPSGSSLRPVARALTLLLAVLLLAAPTNAQLTCAAGQYVNGAACADCPINTYQPDAGSSATECLKCPEPSFAHFPGSASCIACYFGEPKVIAGTGGLYPNNMPKEQPTTGYQVASLNTGLLSCDVTNTFSTSCTNAGLQASLGSGSMFVTEVDATCRVRVFVAGNAACSNASTLAVVEGAYKDLTTVNTIDTGSSTFGLQLSASSIKIYGFDANGLPSGECTDTLTPAAPGVNDDSCPARTAVDANPQFSANPDVFRPSQCAPCDTGSTCAGGAAMPAACPAGQYTPMIGSLTCSGCPTGTASGGGAETCQECAPGTWPTATHTSCELCPGGTYRNSADPADTCISCPVGTFREADGGDGTECTKCTPGTFQALTGQTVCENCAAGYATDLEGQTECFACLPGEYASEVGSHVCNVCPPGQFSPQAAAPACDVCGAGEITLGTEDGKGATECVACTSGTWKPADATDNKCRSCPAGHETLVASKASTCTPCAAGKASSLPNQVTCKTCGPATYTDVPGSRICRFCAAGTVSGPLPGSTTASSASGATSCTPCGLRTFRPSIFAANVCTVCPKGRETRKLTGATTCTACIPGTTLAANNDVNCTACAKGAFASAQGMSGTCPLCPAGYAVDDAGNSQCDVCAPGSYQNTAGQFTCIECPVGTYTEMTGSTRLAACLPAPKGNYAEGTGNDGFTPCEGGTYQDQAGKGSCKDCPPGYECPTGSILPKACRPGFYADLKQPWCKECAKGTYQDMAAQRACKPCPAGAYCQATKMSSPTPCPAGRFGIKFSSVTANDCAKCPINTYSTAAGSTVCQKCSANQWTGRLAGQKLCWATSQRLP